MNKQEFLELQQEFALDVFNFEQFLKAQYITDLNYNTTFFNQLIPNRKLDLENKMLFDSIRLKDNGSESEVVSYLKKAKEQYAQEKEASYRKNVNAKVILDKIRNTPNEKKLEFDEYFKEFVIENNPIVRFNKNNEASATYELLTKLYRDGDFDNFKNIYNNSNKVFLIEKEVPAERYVEFSRLYYNTRKKFNAAINQADQHYPISKMPVLNTPETIAKEKEELEQKNKSLEEINVNLHKDFQNAFGFDASIE